MKHLTRKETRTSATIAGLSNIPWPSVDADAPAALLARCPAAAPTPLVDRPDLADRIGVAAVHIKDERARMGLGSFKALGAAYVIACDADAKRISGRTYVTASAGNHGLSVAAGAQAFGAASVVYLAETVPESFAERLRRLGADVRRHGLVYEDSMVEAARAADANGWTLLSDSSWQGYVDIPHRLMEGYSVLMRETTTTLDAPTHIFLQAGVGGLAAACAAYARHAWGDAPRIVVVEPDAAPAIFDSVLAGAPRVTTGPCSAMGRLDCKEPSLIAMKGLARDANDYVLISEDEGARGSAVSAEIGMASTASGAGRIGGAAGLRATSRCFGPDT